jgi:hypothetical protein
MTDISTGIDSDSGTDNGTDSGTDIPEFPMTRAPGCPFAPPPKALALNAARQLSRVRIWDGSTPWLIHGHDAIRALFTVVSEMLSAAGEDDHLESGMVLALTGYVWQRRRGCGLQPRHRPHHRRWPRSAHGQPVLG